jgi:hypothetical protein
MSTLDELNERGMGTLLGLIGLMILEAEEGSLSCMRRRLSRLRIPHAATGRS